MGGGAIARGIELRAMVVTGMAMALADAAVLDVGPMYATEYCSMPWRKAVDSLATPRRSPREAAEN